MADQRFPKFNFNTILFTLLAIVIIYALVKGFIWAWETMAGWSTMQNQKSKKTRHKKNHATEVT